MKTARYALLAGLVVLAWTPALVWIAAYIEQAIKVELQKLVG